MKKSCRSRRRETVPMLTAIVVCMYYECSGRSLSQFKKKKLAMIPARLSLSDRRRQQLRDERLWTREVQGASQHNVSRLHCPCTKCQGRKRLLIQNVRDHLIRYGRDPTSRRWTKEGTLDPSDEEWEEEFWRDSNVTTLEVNATVNVRGMVDEALVPIEETPSVEERFQEEVLGAFAVIDSIHEEYSDKGLQHGGETKRCSDHEQPPEEALNFDRSALEEYMGILYDGACSSLLATTVLLMNLCTVHGESNACANKLFGILSKHVLLENNTLSQTYFAAKSLTEKLGLSYNTIHACESGCILFRGEHANVLRCPKCGGRRFKDEDCKAFPLKVLRHFPIIPRLQQMYRSPALAKLMVWHHENRSNQKGGGLVRHPCDSKAWRHFHENVDPTFAHDPRHAHFALAADGVNPFKQNRSSWSTWPMLLLNYNVPPWLCTKKFFVLLTLLIPGRESVTLEVFDVYLEPVVNELLQLWSRVPTHDVTKDVGNQAFYLHTMLLWTIHDFPRYGTVGGFSHQGYAACPWCGMDLGIEHSVELDKCTYCGTRHWLPDGHPFKSQEMQDHFNGTRETRAKPRAVTVEE